jgi:hypothetical protein
MTITAAMPHFCGLPTARTRLPSARFYLEVRTILKLLLCEDVQKCRHGIYILTCRYALSFPLVGNAAIFDYATGGPCFGAADLIIGEPKAAVMGGFAGPDSMDISSSAGSLKEGKCSIGGTYDVVGNWPVRGSFQLVQLEVYCNAAIAADSSSEGPSWWPF